MSLPSSQPQDHKKRRARGWLLPVLALTSLLRKVKAASKMKSSFKNVQYNYQYQIDEEEYYYNSESEEEEGGIWQRSILMGEKCKPLEFSGAIYYDHKGEKLEEMPQRTPRDRLTKDQEEGFGEEGGVWQRTILMGGKCQPLEFSGVIRYDEKGRRLEAGTPTRARPLHSFMSRAGIK